MAMPLMPPAPWTWRSSWLHKIRINRAPSGSFVGRRFFLESDYRKTPIHTFCYSRVEGGGGGFMTSKDLALRIDHFEFDSEDELFAAMHGAGK